MLGTLDPNDKADWKEHVETLTHAYNVTKHDSTGFSPFYLMFGRHPLLPVELVFRRTKDSDSESDESTTDYVRNLQERLEEAYKVAAAVARASQDKQKEVYDRTAKADDFQPGDRVLELVKGFKGKHKIQYRWRGPYVVLEKMGGSPVYIIKHEEIGHERTVHRRLLRQCMFLSKEENVPADIISEVVENDHGLLRSDMIDTPESESADSGFIEMDIPASETIQIEEIDQEHREQIPEENDVVQLESDNLHQPHRDSEAGTEPEIVEEQGRPQRMRQRPKYLDDYMCGVQSCQATRDTVWYKEKLQQGRKLFEELRHKLR